MTNQRIEMWSKIFSVWCSKRYEDVKFNLLSVLEIKAVVKNELKYKSVALKELYLSNVASDSTSEASTQKISIKISLHYISKILNTLKYQSSHLICLWFLVGREPGK